MRGFLRKVRSTVGLGIGATPGQMLEIRAEQPACPFVRSAPSGAAHPLSAFPFITRDGNVAHGTLRFAFLAPPGAIHPLIAFFRHLPCAELWTGDLAKAGTSAMVGTSTGTRRWWDGNTAQLTAPTVTESVELLTDFHDAQRGSEGRCAALSRSVPSTVGLGIACRQERLHLCQE